MSSRKLKIVSNLHSCLWWNGKSFKKLSFNLDGWLHRLLYFFCHAFFWLTENHQNRLFTKKFNKRHQRTFRFCSHKIIPLQKVVSFIERISYKRYVVQCSNKQVLYLNCLILYNKAAQLADCGLVASLFKYGPEIAKTPKFG